jgi:hypothetical protein
LLCHFACHFAFEGCFQGFGKEGIQVHQMEKPNTNWQKPNWSSYILTFSILVLDLENKLVVSYA